MHSFVHLHVCFCALEIRSTTDLQQSQIVLLAPLQDRTKQDRRCSHNTVPWLTSWPLSFGCSEQNLPDQSFLVQSCNMAEPTQLREVAPFSDLYEFHRCALCHEVSHHELYANIPSLSVRQHSFLHYPTFITTGEDPKKDQLKTGNFAVFERSRSVNTEWYVSVDTSAILPMLFKSCVGIPT